ncbi:MAG: NAD-dependent epimerase/dehydratase family protein [Microgenomates group bacterium]|nr:NAD-dependent epimerase/dehydratase family protein [Microgenomates group bacterium]
MKILVTGGQGFIGKHLVKILAKKHEVSILSSRPTSGKNIILGDITNRELILKIVPNFKMVFHLGAVLGTSELINKAYEASKINILGTINILDGAKKNFTKVVYVTKPNVWLNTYTITKQAGEKFVKMYSKYFGLPSVIIKWFNVYGPGQSFHCQKAVPFFILWALKNQPIKIWGDGNQTMDLIYVTDAVRAAVLISEKNTLNGKTIEVGSGIEITVNDLAKKIIELTKSRSKIIYLPMRIGEDPGTKLKAKNKILKNLGFKIRVNLREGLTRTINWYKKNL